jgi:hypothetical protein
VAQIRCQDNALRGERTGPGAGLSAARALPGLAMGIRIRPSSETGSWPGLVSPAGADVRRAVSGVGPRTIVRYGRIRAWPLFSSTGGLPAATTPQSMAT